MYDNYNYPMGADNPDAPWNEPIQQERAFTCEVTETYTRTVCIKTDKYTKYVEKDEDGTGLCEIDTSDVDWEQEYKDSCYTIQDLLKELNIYLKQELENTKEDSLKTKRIKNMLSNCEAWEQSELYVEQI